MRVLRAISIVSAILLWMGLLTVGPSQAAISPCAGTARSRFDGAQIPSQTSTYGVRSDIEYQNADLCGQAEFFSVTWNMITAHNPNTGGPGWVQTGYGDFDESKTGAWSWGQSNKGCDADQLNCQSLRDWWGDTLTGDTPTWTYTTRYYISDGHMHMIVNGTQIGEPLWEPGNNWNASWQGQFYGETKYRQSDVSGTPGDHTSFTNNQRLTISNGNGTWNDITGMSTPVADVCRWDAETITAGQSFRIWTSHPNGDC